MILKTINTNRFLISTPYCYKNSFFFPSYSSSLLIPLTILHRVKSRRRQRVIYKKEKDTIVETKTKTTKKFRRNKTHVTRGTSSVGGATDSESRVSGTLTTLGVVMVTASRIRKASWEHFSSIQNWISEEFVFRLLAGRKVSEKCETFDGVWVFSFSFNFRDVLELLVEFS